MQLSLKTILINGTDPDPKEWAIGFGEWPQPVDNVAAALNWVFDIFTTRYPDFEDYSILIQAPPDDVKVYITVNATLIEDVGHMVYREKKYIINELWEVEPDAEPIQE